MKLIKKGTSCPRCSSSTFRRLRRTSKERLVPGLKKYECSKCYTISYKIFGLIIKAKSY